MQRKMASTEADSMSDIKRRLDRLENFEREQSHRAKFQESWMQTEVAKLKTILEGVVHKVDTLPAKKDFIRLEKHVNSVGEAIDEHEEKYDELSERYQQLAIKFNAINSLTSQFLSDYASLQQKVNLEEKKIEKEFQNLDHRIKVSTLRLEKEIDNLVRTCDKIRVNIKSLKRDNGVVTESDSCQVDLDHSQVSLTNLNEIGDNEELTEIPIALDIKENVVVPDNKNNDENCNEGDVIKEIAERNITLKMRRNF